MVAHEAQRTSAPGRVREAGPVPDLPDDPPVATPGALVRVDDPDDPRLALYRDLNDPAGRMRVDTDQAVFVVEGRLAVHRLLSSGYEMRSLLVDDHQLVAAAGLVAAVRYRGVPVFAGSRALVAGTVGFALHRGIVAVASRPPPAGAGSVLTGAVRSARHRGAPSVVAVLEGLNDHENVGALFRNAAAFGVAGILLDPTCADPLYRRSIRVSVGHVLHVPFGRVTPWPAGLHDIRAAGFVVAALTPHPEAAGAAPVVDLAELKASAAGAGRPAGIALLLGAEGPGVTAGALAASDLAVSIPMADGVDSLNVATAAAIAFHALAAP
jgi:tRNA G18 (ribose-2'-O)-methylase SpoU